MKQEVVLKTVDELNADILKITMKIKALYPELSRDLSEMPETIPNQAHPKMDADSLTAYYSSLEKLLKSYSLTHNDE